MFIPPLKYGGIEFSPVSAWHIALLMQDENPLWIGGDVSKEHILSAMVYLTAKYPDNVLDEAFFKPRSLKMAEVMTENGYEKTMDVLLQHIEDSCKMPMVFNIDEKSGKQSYVPLPFRLVSVALSRIPGLSQADAWNMPFSRLVCYILSINDGISVHIADEAKIEQLRAMQKGA